MTRAFPFAIALACAAPAFARGHEPCGTAFGIGGGGLQLPDPGGSGAALSTSGDLEFGAYCGRFLGAAHGALLASGTGILGSSGAPGTGWLGAGEVRARIVRGLFAMLGGGYYDLRLTKRDLSAWYGIGGAGYRFDPAEQIGVRLEGGAGASATGAVYLWRLTIEIKIPEEQD